MVWLLFFFKQKTAYEMRISDWSSDVCSSDLPELPVLGPMIEAWRRGRSARNFSEIQWEEFLDRPLEEVRAALLLGPAPRYRAAEPEAKRIEVEFQVRRELALQRERNLEPA